MFKIIFSKTRAEDELKTLLKEIKKDRNILGAYLFGSYLTGNTKEESDVDVCVFFETESLK